MIADVLQETYTIDNVVPYTIGNTTQRYEILESVVIDGHEVAWMKCTTYYPDNNDTSWPAAGLFDFGTYEMLCECSFADRDRVLEPQRDCVYYQAAAYLRILQFRRGYEDRFLANAVEHEVFGLGMFAQEIIMDLIERAEAHEWVIGAYPGSVEGHILLLDAWKVIDDPSIDMWDLADSMVKAGLISRTDSYVYAYSNPED